MIDLPLEAKTRGEIAHLLIRSRINGEHTLDPPLARNLNKMAHKQMTKASSLPFIADRYGTLAAGSIIADAKPAYADFPFFPGLMPQRHKCHVAPIVDVCQSSDHIVGRLYLAEESISSRRGGQTLNERSLETGILLANGAD